MDIDYSLLQENARGLSVLYVEDDEDLLKSTSSLFLNFFEDLDCAKNGEEGLELYRLKYQNTGKYYDIVITDIHMPKMSGLEMSKEMKAAFAEQVLIFITAYNEIEYLNEGISMGIKGFLVKPINIEELKELIYRVTQKLADKRLLEQHYQQIEEQNMLHIDKKDASGLNQAQDILADLKSAKTLISNLWMEHSIVQERLARHYIDAEFFRSHYAIKVIEYFLSVINGENKAGNCPVIFIMLDFFKNKKLPLEDIFMVCVMFKNTVTSYVFSRYSYNHSLFEDISFILDKNFEGVIINYLDMNYQCKEQEKEKDEKKKSKETCSIVEKESKGEVVNYAEYILENDLYELQDLEEEIDSLAIAATGNSVTFEDLEALGKRIYAYGQTLSSYPLFSELGKYIVLLGEKFLENAMLLYEERSKMENISALIEGFVNDLIVWRREVFEHNIDDPNFLNQSFFSNVDTIIMYIEYDESAVVEDDDLDDMFF